ncbi:MAG: hypothetical protein HQK83_08135 [Fibrobacteria bacterium]|nr:hypothetical protein [Fibrobacteria bacterium]
MFVSGTDTVKLIVSASATNPDGTIEKYYWDKGADGWDDSTDTPELEFYSENCGELPVVWGARNDDGVIRSDTFSIRFNCPPSNPDVISPSGNNSWSDYDKTEGNGTLTLKFNALDPDGNADTLIYTLFTGFNIETLKQVYIGTSTQYNLENIDTNSIVFWKLRIRDLNGDSAVDSGTFTAPPRPPYICYKGNFQDIRDSIRYSCVEIGNQIWMAENLNHIPASGDSWCYDDLPSNCDSLGRLYSWKRAIENTNGSIKDICPIGWHLPTLTEWMTLNKETGGGGKSDMLKSKDFWNGTDDYGFSALPAGYQSSYDYMGLGSQTRIWSSTIDTDGRSWYYILHGTHQVYENYYTAFPMNGYSVRCLED